MAKVIAPFKIVGTLDELNFYVDQNNQNLVRTKGKTGVSSEEFHKNPIFTKIKNHGKEFGKAAKIAQEFRKLAHPLNNRAKDGSFAGRANKLMLEIIQEDNVNSQGKRAFETGINQPESRSFFIGFEGNKTRPLLKVLKAKWNWDEKNNTFSVANLNLKNQIDWPELAENSHFVIARSVWNFKQNEFVTQYSEEIILNKEVNNQDINLTIEHKNSIDASEKESNIELVYCFIGFSVQERKKTKELKRINNTVSIIWSK